jgi:hypothetical protein
MTWQFLLAHNLAMAGAPWRSWYLAQRYERDPFDERTWNPSCGRAVDAQGYVEGWLRDEIDRRWPTLAGI